MEVLFGTQDLTHFQRPRRWSWNPDKINLSSQWKAIAYTKCTTNSGIGMIKDGKKDPCSQRNGNNTVDLLCVMVVHTNQHDVAMKDFLKDKINISVRQIILYSVDKHHPIK